MGQRIKMGCHGFKLVAYTDQRAKCLETRYFLTEPPMSQIKAFSNEMVAKYGIGIDIACEETKYLELGRVS